ncbi:hypothetical protein COO60DRAFT_957539 [Scenedesmus sp. NREL 46B-D3]|nr:hypothetical protein COO60DRAFT_957539 [Scenedesmus sp. NREL 46B-D3]
MTTTACQAAEGLGVYLAVASLQLFASAARQHGAASLSWPCLLSITSVIQQVDCMPNWLHVACMLVVRKHTRRNTDGLQVLFFVTEYACLVSCNPSACMRSR